MQRQTFKLIVTVTDNCIEICQYLCKNITDINKLGVRVHIEKISKVEFDEVMVDTLRRKGITRLPALVAPDGKLFIGMKNIVDLFERNLRPARNTDRIGAVDSNSEMGSNPDLTSFYMKELYSGRDNNGKMVPRADDDEENDDHAAITKSLANYGKKVPRHRQEHNREIDIDPQPRQRQRQHYEDNIETDDIYEEPAPRMREQPVNRPMDAGEDALDHRMMTAWLSNNPAD